VLRAFAPWRVDWGGELRLERDGVTEDVVVEQASSYRLELENLADAIAGDAPALLGRADALGQARAIDALYRSAEQHAAVAL
jgi:predicted dehydrogenase